MSEHTSDLLFALCVLVLAFILAHSYVQRADRVDQALVASLSAKTIQLEAEVRGLEERQAELPDCFQLNVR